MARIGSVNVVVACGVAAAIASAACNDRGRSREARGHEGAPITLSGCLQKGDGITNTYILTQVNEPTRSVGTSGSASGGAVVEQEKTREAKRAYRLDGDTDQLEGLVGKQVRVEGVIADASDVYKKSQDAKKDDKPLDIDAKDLAKVDVKSISQVADACGSANR